MKTSDLTVAALLDPLDDCAAVYPFPMFDNAYIFPAARLTLYRDAARRDLPRWALLIERCHRSRRSTGSGWPKRQSRVRK